MEKILSHMYFVKIAPLIKWTQRDVLHEAMSVSFIPVIIHFTDLFARTQMWIYKHPSTVKFSTDIVSQGQFNLFSFTVCLERMSDREMTEQSGFNSIF